MSDDGYAPFEYGPGTCAHEANREPDFELDHNNRPVPADESPDTLIKVWTVRREPSGDYDSVIVRGWGDMLDHVRDSMEAALEDEELTDDGNDSEGVTITVKLRKMTRSAYDAIQEE